MSIKFPSLLSAAVLLAACAVPGHATLANTSVDGSLELSGSASNYFDPLNGFVPSTGYLNASGTPVTISDTDAEFGFDDGSSLISADFSGDQLTVSDSAEMAAASNGFVMTFTDAAFSGQKIALTSDSFPLSSYSLTGDVLTLNYGGANQVVGQNFSAQFAFVATPEPSTLRFLSLAAFAGFAVCVIRSCRFSKS